MTARQIRAFGAVPLYKPTGPPDTTMPVSTRRRQYTDRATKLKPTRKPAYTLTAFAQGSMGCVFRAKSERSGKVTKVEEFSAKTGMLEAEIMERLRGGEHIALTENAVVTTKHSSGNAFELRALGSPRFEIPASLYLNAEKGCGKLATALRRGVDKLLVARGEEYDGDVRDLGRRLDLADFAAQMDEALSFLKARYVVHRDIKPENVYYLAAGSGITYKLGDFGLATFADEAGTTVDSVYAGTMVFMDKPCLAEWERDLLPRRRSRSKSFPCSTFASDRFALGATMIQLWARCLGDAGDGPLYARPQGDNESDFDYCRTTIDRWTAYLNHRGPLPAVAVRQDMDEPTKRLIAGYYVTAA